jgi:hypothetical protein
MANPELDELEQMSAVATYCKAARLLQMAEGRCAALGVHPRGALAERARRFTKMLAGSNTQAAMPCAASTCSARTRRGLLLGADPVLDLLEEVIRKAGRQRETGGLGLPGHGMLHNVGSKIVVGEGI